MTFDQKLTCILISFSAFIFYFIFIKPTKKEVTLEYKHVKDKPKELTVFFKKLKTSIVDVKKVKEKPMLVPEEKPKLQKKQIEVKVKEETTRSPYRDIRTFVNFASFDFSPKFEEELIYHFLIREIGDRLDLSLYSKMGCYVLTTGESSATERTVGYFVLSNKKDKTVMQVYLSNNHPNEYVKKISIGEFLLSNSRSKLESMKENYKYL